MTITLETQLKTMKNPATPGEEQFTESSGYTWIAETTSYAADFESLRQQVEQLTPLRNEFVRFAETHSPPNSWWDEDTNPFEEED